MPGMGRECGSAIRSPRCKRRNSTPASILVSEENGGVLISFAIFAAEVELESAVTGAQQAQVVPTPGSCVRAKSGRLGRRDDRQVDVLPKVMSNAVYYSALFNGKPTSLKARLGTVGARTSDAMKDADLP